MARYFLSALVLGALVFGCRQKTDDPPDPILPPTAPSLLSQISETQTSVTINWFDASSNEEGFLIQQLINSNWTLLRQVDSHATVGTYPNVTLSNLVPGAVYHIRVVAFNEGGQSAPSNELDAQPESLPLPPPPVNIAANAISSTLVRVSWSDPGNLDSFLIDRRLVSGSWQRVGAIADNHSTYDDGTVTESSSYFYRVASKNAGGIAWSADSATVTTPDADAPLAPEDLHAQVFVGDRIELSWIDRSTNETGFQLQGALTGQQFADLATVGPDIAGYVDHPLVEGVYNYRVRAFNGSGNSAWAELAGVDFMFCSRGYFPICVGNVWEYLVHDSTGPDLPFRRSVQRMETLAGLDFFLFMNGPLGGQGADTLYYLRNGSNGVQYVDHPLVGSPTPAVFFPYPSSSGSFSIVGGDCVLVASTTATVFYGDSTYRNCYDYQIFTRGAGASRQEIFIKPELGIVREIDRNGPNTVAIRDLTFVSLR